MNTNFKAVANKEYSLVGRNFFVNLMESQIARCAPYKSDCFNCNGLHCLFWGDQWSSKQQIASFLHRSWNACTNVASKGFIRASVMSSYKFPNNLYHSSVSLLMHESLGTKLTHASNLQHFVSCIPLPFWCWHQVLCQEGLSRCAHDLQHVGDFADR